MKLTVLPLVALFVPLILPGLSSAVVDNVPLVEAVKVPAKPDEQL